MHTRVKVCGITNLDDAELAVELGAWAVGLIFYEGSPRRCSVEAAQSITAALRRRVEVCGVFVNAALEEVVQSSEELGLSMLQFHGDEGPAFCAEATRRNGAKVIKAAQVLGPGDIRDLERFHVDFHLLDARATSTPEKLGLRGGTGETFDWKLLSERRSKVPLILSGGLNAGNVTAAIAVARPFAVDTASGTERAPGRKDPEKLRAFFEAVERSSTDGGSTRQQDPEMGALVLAETAVESASVDAAIEGAPADAVVEGAPAGTAVEGAQA
jgi:phosphoribosylanthranilate isomerase